MPVDPATLDRLSSGARGLIERCFEDIPNGTALDAHVHILGLGTGGSGAAVDPRLLSWAHPFHRLKALLFFRAAGITDQSQADRQYVDRLLALARPFGAKLAILAFDHPYAADGTAQPERSEIFVPNEYVVALAEAHPDTFIPVASVHPYRADALAELDKWAARGVRLIKWLPNAQGMDPADPRIEPYYRRLVDLSLTLITHTGLELAVASRANQGLGNPLLYRRALDLGVTVVMAHAASLGKGDDLDNPGLRASHFDFLIRLLEEPRHEGRLFADISAMTQWNRLVRPLVELLARPDLHPRLVNGSDWPLPAVPLVILTRTLMRHGLISPEEHGHLNEIRRVNPLLFDFVCKRTVHHPLTGERFPAQVFTTAAVGGLYRR